jgi:hypothetical protein
MQLSAKFLLIKFLLIVALLAMRVVPFVHAHEDGELPTDHDARPHWHLHGHEHEHGHGRHGHGHQGHGPDHVHEQRHERAVGAGSCSLAGVDHADHDDDAVYVELVSSAGGTAESRAAVLVAPEDIALVAALSASVALSPPEAVAEPPPRIRLDGVPLYLRNLSLRI